MSGCSLLSNEIADPQLASDLAHRFGQATPEHDLGNENTVAEDSPIDRRSNLSNGDGTESQQRSEDESKDDSDASTADGGTVPIAYEAAQVDGPHDGTFDATRTLSLADALSAALAQNGRIQVLGYVPREFATRGDIEQAQFDPVLTAGSEWTQGQQQVESAIQAFGAGAASISSSSFAAPAGLPGQLNVEKRWQSGTRARLGYNTNYNQTSPAGQFLVVNPAYRSGLGLTVEQPLWKGLGRDQNTLGIRIAKIQHSQSQAEFLAEVNRILLDIQRAYWEAWQAQSDVDGYEQMAEQARQIWAKEQKRLELGVGTLAEVAQARENYETLRVQTEQARSRFRSAINALRALMGAEARDRSELRLADLPQFPESLPHLPSSIDAALQRRPELEAQAQSLHAARLELERRRNDLDPDIRALGGYSLNGLSGDLTGSVQQLGSANFGNWSVGIRYEQAIGQRAPKAAIQRAELAVSRQAAALRDRRQQIAHEVRAAYDEIETAQSVAARQHDRLEASRLQYSTYRRLHEEDQLDLDRFLRAQIAYVDAQRQERAARVELSLALAQWRHAVGDSLTNP